MTVAAPSSRPVPGAGASPSEIDVLINEAGKRGFVWHLFRTNQHGPEILAGVLRWPTCSDVVVLIDDHRSHAYRVPTGDPRESRCSRPEQVHWFYGLSADVGMTWVLRALLTLPHPAEPHGLPTPVAVPAAIGVPGDRLPVVIRRR